MGPRSLGASGVASRAGDSTQAHQFMTRKDRKREEVRLKYNKYYAKQREEMMNFARTTTAQTQKLP